MMLPNRFLLLSNALLLLSSFANAEATAEVRGIVLDGRDGQAIPSATIHIDGAASETHTDSFGRFRFASVAPGSHMLQVASPGYKTTETPFAVDAGATKEFQVSLVPYRFEQSAPANR